MADLFWVRPHPDDGHIRVNDRPDGHFYTSIQLPLDILIATLRSAWLGLPSDHGADVSRRMAGGT